MATGDNVSPVGTEKIRVAVRVRPLDKRETDLNTKCVIYVAKEQLTLTHPSQEKQPKPFTFDHCFDSIHVDRPNFCDQAQVFETVGGDVIENAFAGYNACVFAYGQTGSGKSYTMMGTPKNPGLIPRLCTAIFERIEADTNDTTSFKVEVSYMEIYNEKVRDLLDPKINAKGPLKVREHKVLGPMVEGLAVLAVSGYAQIARLLDDGNKCRTVAATNMNTESSRSHAVFTIRLTQTMADQSNIKFTGEKVSRISLVDLAGSERAQKTGAIGRRLEEGANINKSLTTLGMVISALADRSVSTARREKFIPYRDSVLTWLLKDNLGGNSKTVMIATVSPSSDNYEETLSTLRYADSAKKIVNHAKVNEDPNAKIIRELREEVETLRLQITQNRGIQNEAEELRERLAESERLVALMNKSWEERLRDTDVLNSEHQRDLTKIGVSVAHGGIKVEKDRFFLVNLNSDPSLNELLVYYINDRTIVGNVNPSKHGEQHVDILLQGLGVYARHALLEILPSFSNGDGSETRPRLYVSSLTEGARICVNGCAVEYGYPILLCDGYRLLIGNNHFFRVSCPLDDSLPSSSSANFAQDIASAGGYDRAWLEANSTDYGFPMQEYIEEIAMKHEEEKQAALEKQYEEFQNYIQGLTQTMHLATPSTPMTPSETLLLGGGTSSGLLANFQRHGIKSNFFSWAEKRKELFKQSLDRLKKEIIRAHALAREANLITEELWTGQASGRGLVRYEVTLQIPAANLRPSKIKAGNSVCEPVIVVKWCGMSGWQLWSVERLESKLVDLRELYNEHQHLQPLGNGETSGEDSGHGSARSADNSPTRVLSTLTTFETQEKHNLIGVANVFLEVLFHRLKLDYQVPIISQQGEVCGKLHVEIYRVDDTCTEDNSYHPNAGECFLGRTINCRVRIREASNLPASLSHFVFCQYSFFNLCEMLVVAPQLSTPSSEKKAEKPTTFCFDHEKDFLVVVTEEFLEYVQEDALSIEVWGHRSGGIACNDASEGAVNVNRHRTPQTSFSSNIASGLSRLFSFGGSKTAIAVENNKNNKNSNNLNNIMKSNDNGAHQRTTPNLRDVVVRKQKSLQERWAEVTKRVELWVEILEMNEDGRFVPVDVIPIPVPNGGGDAAALSPGTASGVRTGGIYQLRQGQQRRIRVRLRTIPDEESTWNCLPIGFADISNVSAGAIVVARPEELVIGTASASSLSQSDEDDIENEDDITPRGQQATELLISGAAALRPLDSYQEEDLERIRGQWLNALTDRQTYLESQIQQVTIHNPPSSKSETDWEREQSLISQFVELTEERNAVSLPPANSHIPGAPADWQPPQGIEYYVPVTFLDLDGEELAANEAFEDDLDPCIRTAGLNSPLPFECFERMIPLPIVHKDIFEMNTVCSWDSSIHSCEALNRTPTTASELLYACVNVTCRLAPPFLVNVVLRKRICISLYRRPSLTERIMRRIVGSEKITGTGVYYDIVAHIPKSSLDMEDRSALAMMAVRHTVSFGADGNDAWRSTDRIYDLSSPSDSLSADDDDEDEEGGCVEYRDGVRVVRAPRRHHQPQDAHNFCSYIESYAKAIQAVEWMLKLDRLRQEDAVNNMISSHLQNFRQEKKVKAMKGRALYHSNSLRMKRAVSLPNTINKMALPSSTVAPSRLSAMTNGILPPSGRNTFDASVHLPAPTETTAADMLTSATSSGYASMGNSSPLATAPRPTFLNLLQMNRHTFNQPGSMLSPGVDGGESARLCGIDELPESPVKRSFVNSAAGTHRSSRTATKLRSSFTVPDALSGISIGAEKSTAVHEIVDEEEENEEPEGDSTVACASDDYSCTNRLFSDADKMHAATVSSPTILQRNAPRSMSASRPPQCENPLMTMNGRSSLAGRYSTRGTVKNRPSRQTLEQQQQSARRLCQTRLCQQRHASETGARRQAPQYFANTRQAAATRLSESSTSNGGNNSNNNIKKRCDDVLKN